MKGSALLSVLALLLLIGAVSTTLVGFATHAFEVSQSSTHSKRALHKATSRLIDKGDLNQSAKGQAGRFLLNLSTDYLLRSDEPRLLNLTSLFNTGMACPTPLHLHFPSDLSPQSLRSSMVCNQIAVEHSKILGNLFIESSSSTELPTKLLVKGAVYIRSGKLVEDTFIFALGDIFFAELHSNTSDPIKLELVSLTGRVSIDYAPQNITISKFEGGREPPVDLELLNHQVIRDYRRNTLLLGFNRSLTAR